MNSVLKRIREQQYLSQSFIAKILGIETTKYQLLEAEGYEEFSEKQRETLLLLFGVEERDLMEEYNHSALDTASLGFARAFSGISQQDQREIQKLLNYKIQYLEEKSI